MSPVEQRNTVAVIPSLMKGHHIYKPTETSEGALPMESILGSVMHALINRIAHQRFQGIQPNQMCELPPSLRTLTGELEAQIQVLEPDREENTETLLRLTAQLDAFNGVTTGFTTEATSVTRLFVDRLHRMTSREGLDNIYMGGVSFGQSRAQMDSLAELERQGLLDQLFQLMYTGSVIAGMKDETLGIAQLVDIMSSPLEIGRYSNDFDLTTISHFARAFGYTYTTTARPDKNIIFTRKSVTDGVVCSITPGDSEAMEVIQYIQEHKIPLCQMAIDNPDARSTLNRFYLLVMEGRIKPTVYEYKTLTNKFTEQDADVRAKTYAKRVDGTHNKVAVELVHTALSIIQVAAVTDPEPNNIWRKILSDPELVKEIDVQLQLDRLFSHFRFISGVIQMPTINGAHISDPSLFYGLEQPDLNDVRLSIKEIPPSALVRSIFDHSTADFDALTEYLES